jgi:dTDP-4-amino-4,6-dideoxygalactose transaminase
MEPTPENSREHVQITLSSPELTAEDRTAVMKVLETRHLSRGSQVAAFEEAVCSYLGCRHAVAVNSGTSGLHLAVIAAGIGKNDLVITTPFSFIASANCILYQDAVPIFVDIEPRSMNMDPIQVGRAAEDLLQGRAEAGSWLPRKGVPPSGPEGTLKALLAVDIFGQPADYRALREITDRYQLPLIEDSCEALGSAYRGKQAGTLGDVGVFGFYPNKQLTTGEGGMLVTDREDWAVLYRSLRNQGRGEDQRWLNHVRLGYNYRLDEMSAALGRSQLNRLGQTVDRRAQVAAWYGEGLSIVEELQPVEPVPETTRMSWFVYVVRAPSRQVRDDLQEGLKARGIPSRRYFQPIHLQPLYREKFGFRRGDFPEAEKAGDTCLALPFSTVMKQEEVERVVKAVKEVLST